MLTRANRVRPPSDNRPKNKLAALPSEDFERLRPHLQTIPTVKQIVDPVNEPGSSSVFSERWRRVDDNGHHEWRESVRVNHSERRS